MSGEKDITKSTEVLLNFGAEKLLFCFFFKQFAANIHRTEWLRFIGRKDVST